MNSQQCMLWKKYNYNKYILCISIYLASAYWGDFQIYSNTFGTDYIIAIYISPVHRDKGLHVVSQNFGKNK